MKYATEVRGCRQTAKKASTHKRFAKIPSGFPAVSFRSVGFHIHISIYILCVARAVCYCAHNFFLPLTSRNNFVEVLLPTE